jgi:tRNA nucleotidyltransferase/poly(A) polymerase
MIGDINSRLIEDPSRILRLVRYWVHLETKGKQLSKEYRVAMFTHAPLVTQKLPLGVYLSNIEKLYLRGKADRNMQALISCNLIPFLLPGSHLKLFNVDLSAFVFFCKNKLHEIDHANPKERKEKYSAYHILALLLLPEIILQASYGLNNIDVWIENTLCFFCEHYREPREGEINPQPLREHDKQCLRKNIKGLLKGYFEQYTVFATEFAKQAHRLNASAQQPQSVPPTVNQRGPALQQTFVPGYQRQKASTSRTQAQYQPKHPSEKSTRRDYRPRPTPTITLIDFIPTTTKKQSSSALKK